MWGKLIAGLTCALLLCPASAPAISAGLDFNVFTGVERQWLGAASNRPIVLLPAPPRPPDYLHRIQAQAPGPTAPAIPDEAIRAESEKRWGDAERIYRDLLAKEPARVDLLQKLAETLAAEDKHLEAAQTIAQAADLSPDDADLQLRASEAYGAVDRPDDAAFYNDRALALRPDDLNLLRRRAQLDSWRGNNARALETLKKLVETNPSDLTLQRDLSRVLTWQGQIEDATKYLSAYVEANPKDKDALLDLARLEVARGEEDAATAALNRYREAGGDQETYDREIADLRAHPAAPIRAELEKRFADAERLYREMLAKEPSRGDLLERLADVLAAQNKGLEAAQAIAKAADLRRDDADLQLRTSQAFGAAGSMIEAGRYNDRALALRPDDRELQRRRAEIEMFTGQIAKAEKTLRTMLERDPSDLDLRHDLARVLFRQRRGLDEAANLMSDYLAQHADDKDALLDGANIEAARRHLKEAGELLDRYRKAGGDEATYQRTRASLLAPPRAAATAKGAGAPSNMPPAVIAAEGAKRYDEAVRILRGLLAREPGRVDLWLRLVDNLAPQKKTVEAAEAMAHAADLRPNDADLQLRASEAFGAANRPADALRYVNRALVFRPNDLSLHRRRAQVAIWGGDNAQAEESLRILQAAEPGELSHELDLGRVLSWQGRLEEAIELLSDYAVQRPNDAEGLIALARVEAGRGNFDPAVELLGRYRAAGGDELTYRRDLALFLAWAGWPHTSLAWVEPGLASDPNDFAFHFARAVALWSGYEYGAALGEVDRMTQLRPDAPEIAGVRRTIEVAQRPYAQFDFNARWESDNISGQAAELSYHQPLGDAWWLFAGGSGDYVQSVTGNAFAPIHGGTSFGRGAFYAGAQARLDFATLGSARLGVTDSDRSAAATWQLAVDSRPNDEWRLQLGNMRDFQILTPRALSLGITRIDTALQATYTPDLAWTNVGVVREAELSHNNHFWNAILAPRRAVLRTQHWNVDLGVSGNWYGYSSRVPTDGYYSPAFYQLYQTNAFIYYKMSEEDGISLIVSAGANRDETFRNGFKMTEDVALEATFGSLSDWMVKLRAGYTNHGSASGPGFAAENVGMTLVRRF